MSTAEAEYVAISLALQEVQWLHKMLEEIGCRPRQEEEEAEEEREGDKRVERDESLKERRFVWLYVRLLFIWTILS
jgi:hypothetical protein